jgi:hypothetical protein
MKMHSIRQRLSENWPKAWSFVQPHLEQAGRHTAAELLEKLAQSARSGTAR